MGPLIWEPPANHRSPWKGLRINSTFSQIITISFRSAFASVPLAGTKHKCRGHELAELAHVHSHWPQVLLNEAEGGQADKGQDGGGAGRGAGKPAGRPAKALTGLGLLTTPAQSVRTVPGHLDGLGLEASQEADPGG